MSNATKRLETLAMPPKRQMLGSIGFGILSAISAIALIACSAWLITRSWQQPPVLYLGMAVVGVRAFALGRAVFRYLERITGHNAALQRLAEVRVSIVERMIPLGPDGIANLRRGDLRSRFVDDVDDLQFYPLRVVQPLWGAGISMLAAVAGIMLLDVGAGLALGGCLVVGIGVALLLQTFTTARAERRIAPLRGAYRDALLDHLSAFEVLTAFGGATASGEEVRRASDALDRATRRAALGAGAAAAVMSLATGAAVLAALSIVPTGLEAGALSAPAAAVVVLIALAVFEVAGVAPVAVAALRTVRVSAARVAEAVPDTRPAGIPGDGPVTEAPEARSLVLNGVSAAWPDGRGGLGDPVFRSLDLQLAPGERVLIRGASGAGKTTLAHLLVRFLDHTGDYTLGGQPVASLHPDVVRRSIGLSEQQPWLFDSDIRQNLLFARDTASDDELLDVLDRVGLADWVHERGGLSSPVGERGGLVSGGQAQRIALARVLLHDFPIVILDEPTAGVDADRAAALLADVLNASSGRTVILFSHVSVADELIDRELRLVDGRLETPLARESIVVD